MKYIAIREWEKYQHYKDRCPPWIKLHKEILSSRTWVSISDADKALMVSLMLLASFTENKIPDDPAYIKRVCYLEKTPNFASLLSIGFIELAESVSNDTECLQVIQNAPSSVSVSPSVSDSPKRAKAAAVFEIPPDLDTPEFRQAWEDRLKSCREAHKKITPTAGAKHLEQCKAMGLGRAIAALKYSISYLALIEPNGSKPAASPLRPEERRESWYPKPEITSNCSTKGCTAPNSEIVKHPVRGSLICKSCLAKEQANAVRS